MAASKTPLSGGTSYREIGDFWDKHDLADYWDQTHEVQFDVQIESSVIYFPVERALAERLRSVASDQGTSPEALLKKWVEERIGNSSG
jgi:hypothetical protein